MAPRTDKIGSSRRTVQINGQPASAIFDSGADESFISPKFIQKIGIGYKEKAEKYTLGLLGGAPAEYGDGVIHMESEPVTLNIGEHKEQIILDITNLGNYDVTIGRPWFLKHRGKANIDWLTMEITFEEEELSTPQERIALSRKLAQGARRKRETKQTKRVWVRPKKEERKAIRGIPEAYRDFADVFEDRTEHYLPEHSKWDHEIPLEPGKQPKFGPIYALTKQEAKSLDEYIEKNLKRGYIRPSTSPAGHPVLFVPKKNGKLRLCVDYRTLNAITIKNRYPLPLASELQDKLAKAKIFTTCDLQEGYYHVRIKEGDEWKTAFRTRRGLYEYLIMPFGLTNAPASFQTMINEILREYIDKFVMVYLDDILIYSEKEEDHEQHVRMVLEALRKAKLRVSLDKSEFSVTKTAFLGYIISPGQMAMDPKKIAAIRDWPILKSPKEILEFNGTVNFNRRFIADYSAIAAPLTDLTKKNQKWQWTENEQFAFEELKRRVTMEPILTTFDPVKPAEVEADSSDYALGACLTQEDDQGRKHPIAYWSRKLTAAELNYDIYDKELLAIVEAFKEWRIYLQGAAHQTQVYSDHKNLLYFTTTKELNRRQVRWAETLATYDFKITYRKGIENTRADALSRRPDYIAERKPMNHAILQVNHDGTIGLNKKQIMIAEKLDDSDWKEEIKQSYSRDAGIDSLKKHKENADITKSPEGLWLYNGRIYIPKGLQKKLIKEIHETVTHGHQGIEQTLERVKRNYYIPGARKKTKTVVLECADCAKNKIARHAPYGLLQTPRVPELPWQSVALDFIVKLPGSVEPLTKATYDSILVITDRLTKYGYFLPYREDASADDLAYTFMRTVVANHTLPNEIISDRDKLTRSRFWQSLMNQLGTKSKLSTAYHPQTDGQTERLNQTLEQYLRFYVNYQQDNWVTLLPVAQFAYNSAETNTTKLSPFYANYGFQPEIYHNPLLQKNIVPQARLTAQQIKDLHQELKEDIKFISMKSEKYYNKKKLEGPSLKEGDMVYLHQKNLKTKRPSQKLDHIRTGPFKIEKVVSKVNYRLKLPKGSRIHPTFHISLLEPAPRNAAEAITLEIEGEEVYNVEKVLDAQRINGQLKYLIRWEGYGPEEDTWEPLRNLKGDQVQAMVKELHQKNPHLPTMMEKKPQVANSPKDQTKERPAPRNPPRSRRLPSKYLAHVIRDAPAPQWKKVHEKEAIAPGNPRDQAVALNEVVSRGPPVVSQGPPDEPVGFLPADASSDYDSDRAVRGPPPREQDRSGPRC